MVRDFIRAPQVSKKRLILWSAMQNRATSPFNWSFWFQWVLATTLGWILGGLLPGDLWIGVTVGVLQWLVLRPLVHQAGWWISLSSVGWAMGHVVVVTAMPVGDEVLIGSVLGAMMGIAQWFILRRWFRGGGWWIVASTAGWGLGLFGLMGALLIGAVAGIVTGIVLELLLRLPRPIE